jgi:hypothetical protein
MFLVPGGSLMTLGRKAGVGDPINDYTISGIHAHLLNV